MSRKVGTSRRFVLKNRTIRYRDFINGISTAHRVDGPSDILSSGEEYWMDRGLASRSDGPCAIYADGSEEWRLNGLLHNEDGPAYIHGRSGKQFWSIHGVTMTYEHWLKATGRKS